MKQTFLFFFLLFSVKCLAQNDTLLKEQKGVLFISAYNFLYDTTRSGDLILIPTFPDFFFPTDKFDYKLLTEDSTVFKEGIRLYYFEQREKLKGDAKKFACNDSNECYHFNSFYLIPVTIKYSITLYNEFETCGKSYFDINLSDKHKLIFNLMLKEVHLIDIHKLK